METTANPVTPATRKTLRAIRTRVPGLALMLSVVLAACATEAPRTVVQPQPAPVPPPSTEVFFYPLRGQSPAQQERDRYECYLWARKQTGFDPSSAGLAPHHQVRVVPVPPPGHDVAVGAATGAVLGAIVASPHRSAEGAAVGAIAGAAIGAASDAARQAEAQKLQQRYDQREAQRIARVEQQAGGYRRAMAACLEGRHYSVR